MTGHMPASLISNLPDLQLVIVDDNPGRLQFWILVVQNRWLLLCRTESIPGRKIHLCECIHAQQMISWKLIPADDLSSLGCYEGHLNPLSSSQA